jgi:pseudouridine synthase
MVRLNKYLADCGIGSRRKCDELIISGKVVVNDTIENRLGSKVDIGSDKVKVDGRQVAPVQHHEYIVLHKPKGFVTTTSDEMGRKTVLDLIRVKGRLYPVGRLDKDSTGLLLMTNDGQLAYTLTHPKYAIRKVYKITLDMPLSDKDRKYLENGVELEEGRTSPCAIEYTDVTDRTSLHVTLYQGWKRQVRRMFAKQGYEVKRLKRIQLGSLKLGKMKPGAWRRITRRELHQLKELTAGTDGN